MLLAPLDQNYRRAESSATILLALHIVEQQASVGLEVVTVGGVACRVNTRRSVQRVNLQTRVVGKAVQPRALVEIAGLLAGIAFECRGRLGNILRNAHLAGCYQFVAVAKYGLYLGEFMSVVCSKNQFHSVCEKFLFNNLHLAQSIVDRNLVDNGFDNGVDIRACRVVGRADVVHAVVVDERREPLLRTLLVGVIDRD